MSDAINTLLGLADGDELFTHDPKDVAALQLEVANERLAAAIDAVPIVRQRAADASLKGLRSFADIAPLMLSDTTYKSYPESLIQGRKWKALGAWIDSLSINSACSKVDPGDAATVDQWIDRLNAEGQIVFASSGTSGKSSLFWMNQADFDRSQRWYEKMFNWATGAKPDQSYKFYALFPAQGHYRGVRSMRVLSTKFGAAGHTHFFSSPMLINDSNRLGQVRRQIADGTATPSAIDEVEAVSARRREDVRASIESMAQALKADRETPVLILGNWAMHYELIQTAKAAGCAPGLHPDSIAFCAGGNKGVTLPDDFQQQIETFYGLAPSRYVNFYGMAELLSHMPRCTSGQYHVPPWVVLLTLDREGKRVVEPVGGVATGRAAFLDLSMSSRWGALVSGDRVTVDHNRCACGRPGPTVRPDVVRYADVPDGDDKTTCAGTMEDYIRGAVKAG